MACFQDQSNKVIHVGNLCIETQWLIGRVASALWKGGCRCVRRLANCCVGLCKPVYIILYGAKLVGRLLQDGTQSLPQTAGRGILMLVCIPTRIAGYSDKIAHAPPP